MSENLRTKTHNSDNPYSIVAPALPLNSSNKPTNGPNMGHSVCPSRFPSYLYDTYTCVFQKYLDATVGLGAKNSVGPAGLRALGRLLPKKVGIIFKLDASPSASSPRFRLSLMRLNLIKNMTDTRIKGPLSTHRVRALASSQLTTSGYF